MRESVKFIEVAAAFRAEGEVPASFSDRLAAALDGAAVHEGAAGDPSDAFFAGFARLPYMLRTVASEHTFSSRWHRVDDLHSRTGFVRDRNGPLEYMLDLDRKSYRMTPRDDRAALQPVIFDAATSRQAHTQPGHNKLSYRQRLVGRSDGTRHGLPTTVWSTETRVLLTDSLLPCHDFRVDVDAHIEVASEIGAAFGHDFVPHDAYGWDWHGSRMARFIRVALAEAGCTVAAIQEANKQATDAGERLLEAGHFLLSERTVIDVIEYPTLGVVRDHVVYVRERGEVQIVDVREDGPPLDGLHHEE